MAGKVKSLIDMHWAGSRSLEAIIPNKRGWQSNTPEYYFLPVGYTPALTCTGSYLCMLALVLSLQKFTRSIGPAPSSSAAAVASEKRRTYGKE